VARGTSRSSIWHTSMDLVVVERKTGPADVDFHSILLEVFFFLLCVIAKFIDRVLSPPRSSASSLLF
jgi:hypothetical protein